MTNFHDFSKAHLAEPRLQTTLLTRYEFEIDRKVGLSQDMSNFHQCFRNIFQKLAKSLHDSQFLNIRSINFLIVNYFGYFL